MELLSIWISAFLTIAIFSFLYKDNPVYKFAEHLFIGVSAGYVLIQSLAGTVIPNLLKPLGEAFRGENPLGYWRIGGLVLSLLLLMRLSKKAGWISRWPLALMIGTFAAIRMLGYAQSDLVQQINGTMIPVYGSDLPLFSWQGASVFNNVIIIIGVISVLIYFFFSFEHKGTTKGIAYLGTFFLMVTFGSSFGYTVLGRISLLVGRVQDLYLYAEKRYYYASIVCTVVIILYLIFWEIQNRKKNKIEQ